MADNQADKSPASKEAPAAGSSNSNPNPVDQNAHDLRMMNSGIEGFVKGMASLTDLVVKATESEANADVARIGATVQMLTAVNATEKVLVEAIGSQERMFSAYLQARVQEGAQTQAVVADFNARTVEALGMLIPVALAALAVRHAQVDIRVKTEERKLRTAEAKAPVTDIPGGTVTEKNGELHYAPNGKA